MKNPNNSPPLIEYQQIGSRQSGGGRWAFVRMWISTNIIRVDCVKIAYRSEYYVWYV